jgi:hypothetical protein
MYHCIISVCLSGVFSFLQISAAIAAVLEGKLKVPANRFYLKVKCMCL